MKIMLVDDQEISNFIMKKVIEIAKPSATVIEYTDPQLALSSLPVEQPDIILLDLNMPGITGWQFLSEMQGSSITSKVIIVTSSTSLTDKDHSKTYQNVVDFLIKPLTPKDLTYALSKI